MDAVEEVTVSTSTPGAESAGQGAVQIRFATRSGTNRFQGSGYGYYRRPDWNTNYWFNERDGLPKDKVAVNTQGFRVGGPDQARTSCSTSSTTSSSACPARRRRAAARC